MGETIETAAAGPLRIEYRPLRGLRPYARNARRHTKSQIVKLRASLARFGWTNPMLIADGEMIAGHGRLEAALAMAAERQPIAGNPDPETGPTVDLSHLAPADRVAYRLADNRIALDAGWDNDLLRAEMGELRVAGVDLSLTGFGKADIETILGTAVDARRALADALSYQIVIDCRDEAHQAEMLGTLRAQGLPCRPLIL